jgi:hypothetical protein
MALPRRKLSDHPPKQRERLGFSFFPFVYSFQTAHDFYFYPEAFTVLIVIP